MYPCRCVTYVKITNPDAHDKHTSYDNQDLKGQILEDVVAQPCIHTLYCVLL